MPAVVLVSFGSRPVHADIIADSSADWSTTGTQGAGGWFHGYYNRSTDGNGTYQTGDFTAYTNSAGAGGGAVSPDGNHWTGSAWDLLDEASGPWTFSASEATHPNGTNNGDEHWTIRRWVSDFDGPVTIGWSTAKSNTNCGNGVGARLYLNGALIDSAAIGSGDGTGVTRELDRTISAGDVIDLALTPTGPDGSPSDGCDGSINRLWIDDLVSDLDDDGVLDGDDNCPRDPNPGQADGDSDGVGDVCDNCVDEPNEDQRDRDRDGLGDACDEPLTPDHFDVVISEIHYNPDDGSELEFVEFFNAADAALDLTGWSMTGAVRFVFPDGASIPPGGHVVVCRNSGVLSSTFGLDRTALFEWVAAALDNDGEEVVLLDATGAIVDSVRYDDSLPWDIDADGDGPSLQRLCVEGESENPQNWLADIGSPPTPMGEVQVPQCPPPVLPPPEIAINEIYYHPPGDQEEREYVELTNTTAAPIDLLGYCFSQGFSFCFDTSTVIEPGEFLVVCRDEAAVRSAFGITNTIGNFVGQLSNSGERITLLKPDGTLADSVRYRDEDKWNIAADGLGFSLEKYVPDATSDQPASWTDSGAAEGGGGGGWATASVRGTATSDRVYFYIEGPGEFLIDDVSLVNIADPDRNLLPNGDFDGGIAGWSGNGNHSGSTYNTENEALHVISSGTGTGSSNAVRVEAIEALERSNVTYELKFSYFHVSGSNELVARLSSSTPSRGIYWALVGGGGAGSVSPGAPNNALSTVVPPFATGIGRFPREPFSDEAVWLTTKVIGEATEVELVVDLDTGTQELEMFDDGVSNDGIAGDGVYGASVPPQPHHSVVTFKIVATGPGGQRTSPPRTDTEPVHAYYVSDYQPPSDLPVYTMILPTSSPRSWIAGLNCSTYRSCSFAVGGDVYYDVGIRRRGGSVCGDGDVIKKYLKMKFNRGHEFKGVRRINFQSLWTDKSLIRENLAWDVFEETGNPDCFHDFVRLHANGDYFGLYAEYEHPDARFLARNDLNPDGNLYKATASREQRDGWTYEKKTNESTGNADLVDFIHTMHDIPTNQLVSFFETNTEPDVIIEYQMAQILTNNRDYPHKNHYLFHDTEKGVWFPTAWDIDLVYGKRWDGSFEGVLNDKMDNPGITPWYTTTVRGGGIGNHLLDKFFSQAGTHFRRAYIVRLWNAIQEKYTLEYYDGRIDEYRALLFEEQLEDIDEWGRSRASANDPTAPAEFEPNLERVRDHVRIRRNYLINYLRNTEGFAGSDRLKITEVMYNPLGDDQSEYIEFWNNSGRSIDISGWSVRGVGVETFTFPGGTEVADNEVIILARNPAHFVGVYGNVARTFGPYTGNLSNSGEVLRLRDDGAGYDATVDYLEYGTSDPWPGEPDGLGHSLELFNVSGDIDNDRAENWRSSVSFGGSPGFVHFEGQDVPHFRRGNCNNDQRVDITDALAILLYLFAEREEPRCIDGCDVNGNEGVAIDDALALLQYLFTSQGFVIPAPDPGDCAPAREGFCQQSNCVL